MADLGGVAGHRGCSLVQPASVARSHLYLGLLSGMLDGGGTWI